MRVEVWLFFVEELNIFFEVEDDDGWKDVFEDVDDMKDDCGYDDFVYEYCVFLLLLVWFFCEKIR